MSEPLTPPECDLQDFPFMPLHVARLRDSDLASEAHPEAAWYAVLLWAASWHQLPAASLPDNDAVLTRLCGLGRDIRTFKKHRANALRGFVKCDDGRLYHPVVAEQAREAWASKLQQRWRTECARLKKAGQRSGIEAVLPTFDQFVSGDTTSLSLGTSPPSPAPVPRDVPEADGSCPSGNDVQETGTGTGKDKTADDAGASDWPNGRPLDHAQRLCVLAGTVNLDLARQPGLMTTLGRIHAWREAGASWDQDVEPTVIALAAKARSPIASWKFFDAAIAQSIADNRQALTVPEAHSEAASHDIRPSARLVEKRANHQRHLAGAEQASGLVAARRNL